MPLVNTSTDVPSAHNNCRNDHIVALLETRRNTPLIGYAYIPQVLGIAPSHAFVKEAYRKMILDLFLAPTSMQLLELHFDVDVYSLCQT